MASVRVCEGHGYFEGERCPACDSRGSAVIDSARRRRLSKFVSGALRHFPADAGLSLDEAGWTPLDALVAVVEARYDWADRSVLLGVLTTDPKGRFELATHDGRTVVRASYGHSVEVALEPTDTSVPATLYHGTTPARVEAILREGIKPMDRQHVHLTDTAAAAQSVGRRHAADPAILVVDAAALTDDGHRVVERGDGVYTTDVVPPAYVRVHEQL